MNFVFYPYKKKKKKWSPLSRGVAIWHGPWGHGHEYKQAVWFGGA